MLSTHNTLIYSDLYFGKKKTNGKEIRKQTIFLTPGKR